MRIKRFLLFSILSFSLMTNFVINAFDKTKMLSRTGLSSGLMISGLGIYSLGLVSTPKIAIKKYSNKFLELFFNKPKVNSYLNKGLMISGSTLIAGLAITSISLKYLK